MMFVKDFIPKVMKQKFGMERIMGVFVLDCIGNWDPKPQTQVCSISGKNDVDLQNLMVSYLNYSEYFLEECFKQ